jgi:hypothetical protein
LKTQKLDGFYLTIKKSSINNELSLTFDYSTFPMRYLVRARVKPERQSDLLDAIEQETLGQGSVAGGEYLRNMQDARLCEDGTARWVEVCYCPTPLLEERPYWEEYFDLTRVQDAHNRRKCRDENGSEPWACGDCDCTARLEEKLKKSGTPFLDSLRAGISPADSSSVDDSPERTFPSEPSEMPRTHKL